MATPHVAGAVAVLFSNNPNASADAIESMLLTRATPGAGVLTGLTAGESRQHQRDLRKARAHRKSDRTDVPQPAQPATPFHPAFAFAPPTAPTIPLTATGGVFGNTARSNLSTHGSANLSDAPRAPGRDTGAKPALTAPPDGPKPHPAKCKPNGVILGSGSLPPDKSSGPPYQAEDSSVDDSEQASEASTVRVPLLVTFLGGEAVSLITLCREGPFWP